MDRWRGKDMYFDISFQLYNQAFFNDMSSWSEFSEEKMD